MGETEIGWKLRRGLSVGAGLWSSSEIRTFFSDEVLVPFPIILSFGVRRESRSVPGYRSEERGVLCSTQNACWVAC